MTTGYLLLCTPTQQQRLLWGTQGGVSEGAFLWRGGCHHDIIWPLASPPPHTSSSLLLGRVATASLSGLETLLESSVRSYLVGNAGSRPISEAKQPWACLVLRWGTTGEAHVLYSLSSFGREAVEAGLAWRDFAAHSSCAQSGRVGGRDRGRLLACAHHMTMMVRRVSASQPFIQLPKKPYI